ncbi:ArsR/SmtB family transcription factor [Pelagibaculum spongiae]|uniref:ArsR family transcriptional regulator n=1 Tax=Pelagibaculum spongiae TaxID=2080658 RepID=A0A2V1GYI0_9GAMM|nr:metalloregulator ArsR/SmtB family transcription factor [Pelagibaculum spongiae]PVZ72151.1 ArsR family transcriptional regulator [Pelagibaculum spongiae]
MNTPEITTDALAVMLKAAGDSLRLGILRALKDNSFGVLELCQIFAGKQSGVSHHLKVLSKAGLVAQRREGNAIFYRRALVADQQADADLLVSLYATIDQLPLTGDVQDRLNLVLSERAEHAREFFANHAKEFPDHQDLIAHYPQYGEAIGDLLESIHFPQLAQAVEIGPGQGEFLARLAPRFEKIYAVDISSEMLEQSRQFALDNGYSHIEFIHGDINTVLEKDLKCDCLVLNMVLHHVPTPAQLFKTAAKLINPGGALLITDLCRHNQSWARDNCGDFWLGFDTEELTAWAQSAGLEDGDRLYLGLKNGFQIQLRRFDQPVIGIVKK